MNSRIYLSLQIFTALILSSSILHADDAVEIDREVEQLEAVSKSEGFLNRVKAKYNLSDSQVSELKSQGISDPHIAMAAQLADSSKKPLADILKMRSDGAGWGKIAKDLGIAPREIGQSVASLRRPEEVNKRLEKRIETRVERQGERQAERRAERRTERRQGRDGGSGRGRSK